MRHIFTGFWLASVLVAASSVYACSSSDDKGGGAAQDDAGVGAGVADPSALFDTLKAPTESKLRGVWENKITADGLTRAELRLGFDDAFITVALRCSGVTTILQDIVAYDIENADTATGTFDYPGISLSSDAGTLCGVDLPEGVVSYKITGLSMDLSQADSQDAEKFTKVGDL